MNSVLEKQRDELIEQIATLKLIEFYVRNLDEKMNDLRGKYLKNKEQIKQAEERTELAKDYERLQKRDSELTRQITLLRAKLEFNEQVQAEVINGLCPILSQKCLNLKQDETLETFISSHFVELKTEIWRLENEQKSLVDTLKPAREAEKFSVMLETLKYREAEISDEGKRYKVEKENLLKETYDLEKFLKKLAEVESELKNSGNSDAGSVTMQKAEVEFNCNVGSKCLRIAEFLFSSKTCKEVFYPMVGDWREDYLLALEKGRVLDAVFISTRNYFNFIYTMIICSKFGKLIEFAMKVSDVIEFFNKFSK